MMELAPSTVQNDPERFKRAARALLLLLLLLLLLAPAAPITVLHPASTTPDPTNSPCSRKAG
jgi:hypothetical protein